VWELELSIELVQFPDLSSGEYDIALVPFPF
jgi:hypothetical protein